MKIAATICYLVLLGIVSVQGALIDIEHGFPLWLAVLGIAIPIVGAVSMVLYVLSYKPQRCAWLWKIIPFVLLGFYVITWYVDVVLYPESDDSPQLIGVATFLGALLFFPLVYSSFKLGYSKEFES